MLIVGAFFCVRCTSYGVCTCVVGSCAWRRLPCVQEHVFNGVIMQLDDAALCAVAWPCWHHLSFG